jgi:hypothetical protein
MSCSKTLGYMNYSGIITSIKSTLFEALLVMSAEGSIKISKVVGSLIEASRSSKDSVLKATWLTYGVLCYEIKMSLVTLVMRYWGKKESVLKEP